MAHVVFVSVCVQILTKDSVTVNVDAIVQFRIRDPVASIKYINNAANATRLLAQTTLRNTLGGHTLTEILSSKQTIQNQMCVSENKPLCHMSHTRRKCSQFFNRKIWTMQLIGGGWMSRRSKCELLCLLILFHFSLFVPPPVRMFVYLVRCSEQWLLKLKPRVKPQLRLVASGIDREREF